MTGWANHRVPMRTRGLKQDAHALLESSAQSRSYADARIETTQLRQIGPHQRSRSYADARIETFGYNALRAVEKIAFLCGRAD